MRDEQQALQHKLRDAEERSRSLQSQLGVAMQQAEEADRLQAMQREYEADVSQLRRELESRQTEIDGLKTQMRGRGRLQVEIDRLEGENKEYGKKVAEADLELQRQRLRGDELESELADSRYWRTQAEGRLERSEQALVDLQRELEEARLSRDGDLRLSELQIALNQAQLELRQAQLEQRLQAEEREALQLRLESLQAAGLADQDLRARLREAEERLAELRARHWPTRCGRRLQGWWLRPFPSASRLRPSGHCWTHLRRSARNRVAAAWNCPGFNGTPRLVGAAAGYRAGGPRGDLS